MPGAHPLALGGGLRGVDEQRRLRRRPFAASPAWPGRLRQRGLVVRRARADLAPRLVDANAGFGVNQPRCSRVALYVELLAPEQLMPATGRDPRDDRIEVSSGAREGD